MMAVSLYRAVGALGVLMGLAIGPATAGEYGDRPEARAVIEAVVAQGVERDWAESVVSAAERQQSILEAIARPAEKTKPWHEYREIFLTERRIVAGVEFARRHEEVLAEVASRTGVPAEVIVAIIGVETFYGRISGGYRVIDALSTLAFDYPKRAPFFTGELENFLLLAFESGKDPLQLKGSYAGAMGLGQFMPSSYRAYARDFDGDGVADIWSNPADAIYSVANYFVEHGWRRGGPVIVSAQGAKADPEVFEGGLKPRFSVAELAALGFTTDTAVPADLEATALKLDGVDGPEYWLALPNFYAITRYNHSAMYALSVWQLSRAIAGELAGE